MRQQYIHPQRPKTIDPTKTETIGYFGDSFCSDSIHEQSYCNILASRMGVKEVTHWGVGGTSIWYMFERFMQLRESDALPDNIVIVYTDPDRIYHPDVLLPAWAMGERSQNDLERACDSYMKHLDFPKINLFKYKACVEWFDQTVIRTLPSRHKVVQAFSFDAYGVNITGSPVLDYTFKPLYQQNIDKGIAEEDLINHMTPQQNKDLAEKFSNLLTTL